MYDGGVPTPPTVTKTLRVRLIYAQPAGNPAGSRFYVSYSGSNPDAAACATFATGVRGAWTTHLAPMLSGNAELTAIDVQDLDISAGAAGTDPTAVAGTRSGSNLPQQVAAILEFGIARRYRGGKPKMYTPYGVESDTSSGVIDWTTTFQGQLVSAWNAFMTEVLALGIGGDSLVAQVNVGYYSGFTVVTNPITGRTRDVPKYKSGPITPDQVTSVGMRTLFGSQRRRRTSSTP